MTKGSSIEDVVVKYYSDRLQEHGTSHQGVDWNSAESQELRFDKLLQVCEQLKDFSIVDYGCGYGALFPYLQQRATNFRYIGFDWAQDMVDAGLSLYGEHKNCTFIAGSKFDHKADYAVASGLFNVKLDQDPDQWKEHIIKTIHALDEASTKGFSFNALTSYSDEDRKVSRLYYADPCELFDYCKRNFSRKVALYHDYELYEFTIVVRK